MRDPVVMDELRLERQQEVAQARYETELADTTSRIFDEIMNGEWNDDVMASSRFSHSDIVNLAISKANNTPPPPFALRDFTEGVWALAQDLAEDELRFMS